MHSQGIYIVCPALGFAEGMHNTQKCRACERPLGFNQKKQN